MRLHENSATGFEVKVDLKRMGYLDRDFINQAGDGIGPLPDEIERDLAQAMQAVGHPHFRRVALRRRGFVIGHRWGWGGKAVTSAFEIRLVDDTLFVKRFCQWDGSLWGAYLLVACVGGIIGALFLYMVLSGTNRGATPEQAAALPVLSAFIGGVPGSVFGLVLGSVLVDALFWSAPRKVGHSKMWTSSS